MTIVYGEGAHRVSPSVIATVALGGVAWVAFLAWSATMDMGPSPGSQGLGLFGFVAMWALMMAAMMLPAIAPLVGLYARSVAYSPTRLFAFGFGYLLAWTLSGVAAFMIAEGFADLAKHAATPAHVVAVAGLAGCAVYQLTPVKRWCLRHCRSPIGHLLRYANYQGTTRDLRAGAHHGLICIGCCWLLMVGLIIVGVMNVVMMLVLTAVISLEKRWRYGEHLAKVVGAGLFVLAVAVAFDASLAPGLWWDETSPMSEMDGM